MNVEIRALKTFEHGETIRRGTTFRCSLQVAMEFERKRLAVIIDRSAPPPQNPTPAAGTPSSASPADPASTPQTSSSSDAGETPEVTTADAEPATAETPPTEPESDATPPGMETPTEAAEPEADPPPTKPRGRGRRNEAAG